MIVNINIKRLPETGEYRIGWVENGRDNEDNAYYTDDPKDAADTAFTIFKDEVAKGTPIFMSKGAIKFMNKYVSLLPKEL